jgi:Ca-activated chloride channel family protein
VIAKDAKIQVEFNPEVVSTYRLLGYENRALADSDFRNDAVDAGEVGAGHSVTALYEIVPTEQGSGPALTVRVRYADPSNGEVHEIEQQFDLAASRPFEQTAPQFQLAVTVSGFAELLRENPNTQSYQFSDLVTIVERISPQLANDESVRELLELIKRADDLQG